MNGGKDKESSRTAKTVRVFVGLKIAPEIAQQLHQVARSIAHPTDRLVPSEDLHVTLLPPWDEASVPNAIERLDSVSRAAGPFTLAFTHLSYWPEPRHPRLLCAECEATHAIAALQSALSNAFGAREDKPFRPHVTLARMQRRGRSRLDRSPDHRPLSFVQPIRSVELFRSPAGNRNGYEILASLPLRGPRGTWSKFLGQSLARVRELLTRLASRAGAANVARVDFRTGTKDRLSGEDRA